MSNLFEQILLEYEKEQQISFPKTEWESIKKQLKRTGYVYTTRVSNEYMKYDLGKIYKTPWGESLEVVEAKELIGFFSKPVFAHPFLSELSKEQINLLSKYDRLDIVKLGVLN